MKPRRVVIVADDDDDLRESVATLLRDEGYETRTASEGREVLMILDGLKGTPCVLVLDLDMPIMSGFEVLDVLSNLHRLAEVPVIVCSGFAPPDTLPLGVRLLLPKPFPLEACLTGLRNVCDDEAARPADPSTSQIRVKGVEPFPAAELRMPHRA